MKVFIADDSPTTRFALRKNLREWGYDVVEAADGLAAWEALSQESPPRMAVLDWMMPGMDGVEICRKLTERRGGLLIYTILLTSKTEKEDLVYALDSGAHDFLSKPVHPEELRSRIAVGRRLVEMDQLKTKFLGMAAHDLRNPLISVSGFSHMLLNADLGPLTEHQHEFISIIKDTSENMLSLVNDLLDISVIESGRLDLRPETSDLAGIVERQLKVCRPMAEKKGMVLRKELSRVPELVFDPKRIAQVIDNLLSNAIKFSPRDSVITVTLTLENNSARVSVRDEGPGIDEEDQHRIFGDFARIGTQPTDGEASTGLGLAIVKKIVEAHKGLVEVESRPGSGSTFSFALPIGVGK
ncbi:MAG: ATP-binding protein [Desulfatibacillaceae bacterium]